MHDLALTHVLTRATMGAESEMIRVKYSELEKLLKAAGCRPDREGNNHRMWFSPITGARFPVAYHKTKDVPRGTLKSILKAAGIEQ